MSRVEKNRQPFKLQIMDLLLQIGVPAGIADEVASEVVKESKKDTSIEIIRNMTLDNLKMHDAVAAKKLAKRFEYVEQRLMDVPQKEGSPAGKIYDEEGLDELLEDDQITAAELFFMAGREGRSWQRKKDHRDSGSTELAREEYYED